jgi:glycerol dehydrogenase-like iron-containing ADH family enzyme
VTVGHGVLGPALAGLQSFAVATMPEPWALVDPSIRDRATAVWLAESMERDALEATESALPHVDAIVGIGGGASVDAAE